jgi:hypothetical protein
MMMPVVLPDPLESLSFMGWTRVVDEADSILPYKWGRYKPLTSGLHGQSLRPGRTPDNSTARAISSLAPALAG